MNKSYKSLKNVSATYQHIGLLAFSFSISENNGLTYYFQQVIQPSQQLKEVQALVGIVSLPYSLFASKKVKALLTQ